MALKIGKTSYELGQIALIREQLEARFGALSETVLQRLDAWPTDRLPELGRALLRAGSLAELGLEDAAGGNKLNGAE
jgi:hypothetical protein